VEYLLLVLKSSASWIKRAALVDDGVWADFDQKQRIFNIVFEGDVVGYM